MPSKKRNLQTAATILVQKAITQASKEKPKRSRLLVIASYLKERRTREIFPGGVHFASQHGVVEQDWLGAVNRSARFWSFSLGWNAREKNMKCS